MVKTQKPGDAGLTPDGRPGRILCIKEGAARDHARAHRVS